MVYKPVKVPYVITSEYGYRIHPITKRKQFHKGIDIACKQADSVNIYATEEAIVIHQGWNKERGNYVVLLHPDYITLYQHLHHYITKINMTLKGGELIGTMGTSGKSTGRHLHFEVYTIPYSKRNTINPKHYLKGAK